MKKFYVLLFKINCIFFKILNYNIEILIIYFSRYSFNGIFFKYNYMIGLINLFEYYEFGKCVYVSNFILLFVFCDMICFK